MIEDSNTVWKDIEQTQIPKGNLKHFLLTTHQNKSLHKKLTPPTLATVRAWTHLRSYQNWSGVVTPLKLPISALTQIIPDINLSSWKEKSINYLDEIMDGSSGKPFTNSTARLSTTSHRALQIHTNSPLNNKETTLNHNTTRKSNNPRQTQRKEYMYKIPIHASMGAGVRDRIHISTLGKKHLIHSSTKSTNLGEKQQKISLRWYLTPHSIAKIFPSASSSCWRECGNSGTLIHTLWFCPKLRSLC